MALKGTLADVGAVDLLQFAHTGRKSGELLIQAPEEKARLFYEKGQLVHATMGEAQGLDVLVEVVGWTDAQFEFDSASSTAERSIHVDLPRAVMYALKIRDEREAEGKDSAPGQSWATPEERMAQAMTAQIAHFVANTAGVEYVCVSDEAGKVVAEGGSVPDALDSLDALRKVVHGVVDTYPRDGLARGFFQDEGGTVALARLSGGHTLLVVAGKKVSLGSVSVAVGRLASLIV